MQEETIKAEELERAWKEARSIHNELIKIRLKYLGMKKISDREYFFYQDEEGKFWYETNYDRERIELEKEKKKRSLKLKYRIEGERYGTGKKKP